MIEKRLKNYPGMIVLKKDTEQKIETIKSEIYELEAKQERAERRGYSEERIKFLLGIKEERLRTAQTLLATVEKSMLEIEQAINKALPLFTPLEHILINKLYIEGKRWSQVFDELQTEPEYSRFCYERSTYMRAHRQALDKLIEVSNIKENEVV